MGGPVAGREGHEHGGRARPVRDSTPAAVAPGGESGWGPERAPDPGGPYEPVPAAAPLVVRPHWRHLVRPVVVLFATFGAAGFLLAVAPSGTGRGWVRPVLLAAALLVLLRWSVAPWLGWLGTRYVIGADRLTISDGLVSRRVRVIPFSRLADVLVVCDSFADRVSGAATLVLVPEADREAVEIPSVGGTGRLRAELLARIAACGSPAEWEEDEEGHGEWGGHEKWEGDGEDGRARTEQVTFAIDDEPAWPPEPPGPHTGPGWAL